MTARKDAAERGMRLPENIFFRTGMLSFFMGKAVAPIYGAEMLQSHEWKVMGVLFSYAPLPAAAIAQHVSFDKAAISRAVRSLEQRDFVKRQPQNTDGRSIDIAFTARGERVYRRILEQVSILQEELLAALDPGMAQNLFKAYAAMEDVLRKRLEQAALPITGEAEDAKRQARPVAAGLAGQESWAEKVLRKRRV